MVKRNGDKVLPLDPVVSQMNWSASVRGGADYSLD